MMSDLVASCLAGAVAGLGIAMPLGAIGLLLLRLAMVQGFRAGAAGALGVGSVDLAYCAAAVTIGSRVSPLVESWGRWPLLVSGVVVIGIGARQLVAARRPVIADVAAPTAATTIAVYGRFFALTAANPLTLLYFVALAGVLASTTNGAGARAAFVTGAGLASLTWQLGLAAVGAALHRTVSVRASKVLGVAASAIVILLGVGVIVRTLVAD
jgi:threonine/homoserine/homoserine lactone efflux protein